MYNGKYLVEVEFDNAVKLEYIVTADIADKVNDKLKEQIYKYYGSLPESYKILNKYNLSNAIILKED